MPLPGQKSPRQRARPAPGLLVSGHEVPLPPGETIVGRGTTAQISIASALVSRRHVKLVNQDGRVTVEDLGSRNGIFVNGEPLRGVVLLEDGDTLLVGTTELSFFLGATESSPPSRVCFDEQGNVIADDGESYEKESTTLIRFEAPNAASVMNLDRDDITIQGSAPPIARKTQAPEPPVRIPTMPSLRSASGVEPPREGGALPRSAPVGRIVPSRRGSGPISSPSASPPISTHPPMPASAERSAGAGQDALTSVFPIVDRMLARGDVDAASRAFGAQISRRIDAMRSGAALSRETLDGAAERCLLLFGKNGDASWFDRAIDLHSVARQPMCPSVLEQVAQLLPAMATPSRERFDGYQSIIREMLGEVDAADLELCDRVLAVVP